MKTEIEYLDNHQARLKITADAEQLESAKRQAARKLASRMKIPGFRPGKAPYQVILRHIGEPALLEEALDQLAQELYPKALDETQIDPYGPGTLEQIESIDPPTFNFLVPLAAVVTLGDYNSIRLPYEPTEVQDPEVERVVEDLRQQFAITEPADRPAAEGDQVTIKLEGKKQNSDEGQDPTLITERQFTAVIESENEDKTSEWPFPGFARQLIGLAMGEEKVLTHTFADDSPYESLRAVTAEFKVSVESISSRSLPDLDDNFAKSTNEADTIDELREKIRSDILTDKKIQADSEYNNLLIEKLLESAEIKYSPQMLDHETDDLVHEFEHRLENQGLDLETYLRIMKKSEEDWKSEMREQARKRLERSLVIFHLAKLENIQVSEKELQDETIRTLDALSSSLSEADKRKLGDKNVVNNLINNIMGEMVTAKTYDRLRSIAQGLETVQQSVSLESPALATELDGTKGELEDTPETANAPSLTEVEKE